MTGRPTNTPIPHPAEAHGARRAVATTDSLARGATHRRTRPRTSPETVTASQVARGPKISTGSRMLSGTFWRMSPSTCAPFRTTTDPREITSPRTCAVGARTTVPSSVTTLPLTWPATLTRPLKTTTSPCATP